MTHEQAEIVIEVLRNIKGTLQSIDESLDAIGNMLSDRLPVLTRGE